MKRPLCVLVSGFRIFGDSPVNTSEQALVPLETNSSLEAFGPTNELVVGNVVTKLLHVYWSNIPLETDGLGAADQVEAAIEATSPDIVIGLGMGLTNDFKIEKIATDDDAALSDKRPSPRTPDAGRREFPTDRYSRHTSLPVRTIIRALKREGIHVVRSRNAGHFLCEDVFYRIMRVAKLNLHGSNILRAGFIHLPLYKESGGVNQSEINKGVLIAIRATLSTIHPREYEPARLPGVKSRDDSAFAW